MLRRICLGSISCYGIRNYAREVDMKTLYAPWFRAGVATLVFAMLLTLTEFIMYGSSTLFTAKGALGIIIKTGIFLAVVICAIGTVVNCPAEASGESKENACGGDKPVAS